jgi:RNA polymerase sigma-70 factor (ECF subfamily)
MTENEDSKSCEFVQLFLMSQRRIYGYVMTLVPNVSDADDIVQETASVMWTKFGYLRSQKTRRKFFTEETMRIIEQVEAKEDRQYSIRQDALEQCLRKLSHTERRILSLRYEQGATLKSLAGRLGLDINTLYSRLSKIHLMLLNCVKRVMVEP